MGNWNKYIPKGMKDILFEESNIKLDIEDQLRKIYKYSGFSEIISPTIEFYDVFNSNIQAIPQEKMYKLFDNLGRILVLRPDMTTPIGRITGTKMKDCTYPLKLCYTANIFRVNEKLNGKRGEITQSGIEIIGTKGIKSDVDSIVTAINALLSLGLRNFKIELGEAGLFEALTENMRIEEENLKKLKEIIRNKNYVALKKFLDEISLKYSKEDFEIIENLPKLFGDIEIIEKAKALTKNEKALKSLNDIYNIYKSIEDIGLGSYISIDLGMVQNIDYYTGVIFKGYVEEVGDSILSGGRYDNLIQHFGIELPATGFAINVDDIMIALKKQNTMSMDKDKKVLIFYKEEFLRKAYDFMQELKMKKIICELSLLDEDKEILLYSKKKGIDFIIGFTREEKLFVKDLKSDKIAFLEKNEIEDLLMV
ncbi:ATP phosphoribosyltransferase regulatory subunit [Clostridium botulinum]|uniref:ATP phosphoribosyltransferase regulatory subunit n=2 Tax=Clostridium botulinum TaxID=1491 RepID=HISZ_CLOB6|nr:ATP phosphoribosyltransferase regulatory subunit [Clostridium botulinum]C3KVW9.1 RecName: Full=ATP phosphoribosyltransferase regulatory subunit [Clostridium botulinum Ba4 str. 657]ACQ52482.1 ATP phosphoribosyltransferase, regulatory subunit [Clostridium botulinum Ba4 str. 657]AJE11044.1 ATP phosphoribosyltransferase, regulatory subunit [Clostridium botulinum CDC_1436]AUN03134.1 ATP phosphoribosyltransferase regulatory subunit [Clostridium botulinum]AXG91216.1 ATP phosphoribosyltransferase r